MSEADKAKEIISIFYNITMDLFDATECAIRSVDIILGLGFLTPGRDHERLKESQEYYWLGVKLELKKTLRQMI